MENRDALLNDLLALVGVAATNHPGDTKQAAAQMYPNEMTPALHQVLGLMNFQTGPLADVFRQAGHNVPRKCEAEHAFVLHRLIKLALEHGEAWQGIFGKELTEVTAAVKAAKSENPPQ